MEAEPITSSLRSIQYASVEDRHRIRDSLRSQLRISDKPVTNSPHPNSVAALNEAASQMATSADAARLEELMLLEAIRRSMQDVPVDKNDEDVRRSQCMQQITPGGDKMDEHDSDSDYTDMAPSSTSRSTVSASGVAHYSSESNSFDSNSCNYDMPLRSSDIPS
ncbi:hypothetical protein PsorP6_008507 [Peronosclerospora sorghi]|uniref:Uncharacterized protein n=1 Tax=Peronosclerospora sorghi TaxID=230839 RepID=A0ACC0WCT0_9STRA|nr:hypothetical protein PsorP6_008507 [Peronosclerospora sorghi]